MSFEAMAWASKQQTGNHARKLILLMLANHSNGHTGQCNPSHKRLALECEMSSSTVRKHINDLASMGFLTIIPKFVDGVQLPNQYVLNIDPCRETAEGMPGNGRGVCRETAPNKQEDKPGIETNKAASKDNNFEVFWKAYPRKTNKGFAKKVFDKLKPSDDLLQKILHAIEVQKRSVWQDKDPQYIPHPSTWLNGERWEDELQPAKQAHNPFAGAI